jgi:hypothetical protein
MINVDDRYEVTPLTAPQLQQRHQDGLLAATNRSFDIPLRVPPLNLQLKDHKVSADVKPRPVCSHTKAGPRKAEDALAKILSLVAQQFDLSHVLNSTFDGQCKTPTHTHLIRVRDVDGMYDRIHLQEAYARVSELITTAYAAHPNTCINIYHTKAFWSKKPVPSSPTTQYTLQQSLGLLQWIIFEDYVYTQGTILHSVRGVPMGGAASPQIANLTAAHIEIKLLPYLRQHIPNLLFLRYVDDILTNLPDAQFNALVAPHYAVAGMQMTTTEPLPNGGTPFLEATLHTSTNNPLTTKHYNKRHHLFPQERDLPHQGGGTSHLSHNRQVFPALLRIYRATSNVEDFINSIIHLRSKNPTYHPHLFQKAFTKVLRRPHNRYNVTNPEDRKYGTAIRKMKYFIR